MEMMMEMKTTVRSAPDGSDKYVLTEKPSKVPKNIEHLKSHSCGASCMIGVSKERWIWPQLLGSYFNTFLSDLLAQSTSIPKCSRLKGMAPKLTFIAKESGQIKKLSISILGHFICYSYEKILVE